VALSGKENYDVWKDRTPFCFLRNTTRNHKTIQSLCVFAAHKWFVLPYAFALRIDPLIIRLPRDVLLLEKLPHNKAFINVFPIRFEIFTAMTMKNADFRRNVGSHKIYTAEHPRRRHSSKYFLLGAVMCSKYLLAINVN
jgi:hypothetical protein